MREGAIEDLFNRHRLHLLHNSKWWKELLKGGDQFEMHLSDTILLVCHVLPLLLLPSFLLLA